MKNDDSNGDLFLPHGMRSEYDDEERSVPRRPVREVPRVNPAQQELIAFVNSIRRKVKDAPLPAEYGLLRSIIAKITDEDLPLLKDTDRADAIASLERARRESEAAARSLKRLQGTIWKRMRALRKQMAAQGERSDKNFYSAQGWNRQKAS